MEQVKWIERAEKIGDQFKRIAEVLDNRETQSRFGELYNGKPIKEAVMDAVRLVRAIEMHFKQPPGTETASRVI